MHRSKAAFGCVLTSPRRSSRAHRRSLDRHSLRARHQIEFELDQSRRAVIIALARIPVMQLRKRRCSDPTDCHSSR